MRNALLRVSGILTLPDSAVGAVQLQVETLEVLATVPLALSGTADEAEAAGEFTVDQYGAYLAISSSDTPPCICGPKPGPGSAEPSTPPPSATPSPRMRRPPANPEAESDENVQSLRARSRGRTFFAFRGNGVSCASGSSLPSITS